MSSSRVVAAHALQQVIYQGVSLSEVLPSKTIQALSGLDQSWVKNVCFGCTRWHERLTAILKKMLKKPFKANDQDIDCLLRIGLYQLLYQRTPDHAAVNETVQAARHMNKRWAAGLINAVLRNVLRNREMLLQTVDQVTHQRYAFPPWLLTRIAQAWPDDWEAVLDASNQQAPLTLRVNTLQETLPSYQVQLAQQGLKSQQVKGLTAALQLEQAVDVQTLPGFATGAVSVQDAGAQWAAQLLACQPGDRVLDACAAPGGKTGHLLESQVDLSVLALDNQAERLQRIADNLLRLGLSAEISLADAGQPDSWWDGRYFDRILLDAPCSASGVIRRHPDIKVLRKPTDLLNLQRTQSQLLQALWAILKPGGLMLYVTCSILPEENQQLIKHFLAQNTDAQLRPFTLTAGISVSIGWQVLPGTEDMDGFYYVLLEKAVMEAK